ncbi:hypothetical protein FOXYS1_9462 [Fusarium oxysporum]|uniref:Uncharacterized protein n=1 Tax=Fusarium oxysporum TaxID=5507 RepID=A0A8H5EGJ3_FUSOX|nr:hypothetical protein FOXYS1_9462 [Fusarium oxysporum]
MSVPWRLDDLVTWVIDTSPDKRLSFAHIHGPPASAKAIKIPMEIIESPRIRDDHPTFIVQVLPDFKRNAVIRGQNTWSPNLELEPGQPMLKVETYLESESSPDAISDRILFIIDADPDYSAEYALALAAITTFAASRTTADSGLHIKVATISWECIHQVTRELFESYNGSIFEFSLRRSDPEPTEPVILKTMPSDLLKYATVSPTNDSGPLCLRFRDAMHDAEDLDDWNTMPSQWDPWIRTSNTKGNCSSIPTSLEQPGAKIQMLHMDANSRIAELLPSCHSVSILASPTVRRVIFDRRSHQLLQTFLWVSASEELQQFSWRSRVESYYYPDVLCLDHFKRHRATERRMKIRNEHAEGFMAALLEFTEWPPGIWELMRITQKKDDVFNHGRDRLLFQGITNSEQGQLQLPHRPITREAFYALLPEVNYDWRLAHFLSMHSSPFITMIKAHLAPMLAAGNGPLELLHVRRFDSRTKTAMQECLNQCSLVCGAGAWVRRSTLWAAKGLAGTIDEQPCPDATTPMAGDSIRVLTVASAWLSGFNLVLNRVLRENNVEVEELGTIQESVNEQAYNQISRDLLQAYSHQVAFVSKKKLKEGELPKLYDFFTKRPFKPNLNLAVIDWDYLFGQENKVFGVYTHLKRLSDGGTTVCNWTWIPAGVWREVREEMEKVREKKQTKKENNNDEYWQNKF